MCEKLFNDKRVITIFICIWSLLCAVTFYSIMAFDNSPFLNFGPSERTELFGVKLDSWPVWWAVAVYTFVSTAIAAYASDSIIPWITNTVQDHKTKYIPYSKVTCLVIIQVFTFYGVTQSMIGLFVALTQVDFMIIRLAADFLVNHYTTAWFLRSKEVSAAKYHEWERMQKNDGACSDLSSLEEDYGLHEPRLAMEPGEHTEHSEHNEHSEHSGHNEHNEHNEHSGHNEHNEHNGRSGKYDHNPGRHSDRDEQENPCKFLITPQAPRSDSVTCTQATLTN